MNGLLRQLWGERGSLAVDSRAVSNLIGFILLFSILLLALAGYQAQVVPQETAQSEFEHHQSVQDELIEFRNAVFGTATDDGSSLGSSSATAVTLGTTHPSRTLTIGPPSSAGSLQTSESYNVTVRNARTNHSEEVPTRFVEYEPQYTEYDVGSIWYENSMLYLDDEDADEPIVLADQQLAVEGRSVRVIPAQNEISENGIEATSVEKYAAEAVERNPELYEADSRRMQVVVPTRLDGSEYWDSQLDGSVQYNITNSTEIEGWDVNALELLVEPDIEINTVGFQGGPTENPQRSPNDEEQEREFSTSNNEKPDDELENIYENMSRDEDGRLVITDDHDLQAIGANDSSRSDDYILETNIDASGTDQWNDDDGFDPIGNWEAPQQPFTGSLDGDGYVIDGLTINQTGDGAGLFSWTDDATIQNLGIERADISTEQNNAGGVTGWLENSRIENTYVTGEINGEIWYVGGITGYQLDSSIENSYTDVTVDGDDSVGGLVGYQFESDIQNSYTRGTVIGNENIGGLVGYADSPSSIQHSHSTANVDVDDFAGGGLVGYANDPSGTNQVTIENSYATGYIEGENTLGGILGYSNGGEVTNSYATGAVDGEGEVGGLVGENQNNGVITSSFATGSVEGDGDVGGLVGVDGGSDIDNGYWDRGTTNQEDGVGNADDDEFDIQGFGDVDDASPADEMIGAGALDAGNMSGLSADDWRPLEHPDDYPMLEP